jgi:hypothetical protein
MNDKNTRKLLSESLLRTSKDFTDRVMNKIAKETVPVRIPRWQYVIFVCSLTFLLIVPLLLIKKVPAGLPVFNSSGCLLFRFRFL